jgi:dehydrogenase/reductase SDR family protein 1
MVPRKEGLIVFISSAGSIQYLFNVPYGIGKCAVDRMAIDCGIELRKSKVTSLSLMVGPVKTELISELHKLNDQTSKTQVKINFIHFIIYFIFSFLFKKRTNPITEMFRNGETIEFAGKCIVSLAKEPNVLKYTSKVVIAEDYAHSKGLRDIDGRVIDSFRQVNYWLHRILPDSLKFIANLVPNFIKIPTFVISIMTSKF